MTNLVLSSGQEIPQAEFEFTFARSGGPGGQNVNKVNSKAVMHWNVVSSPSVPDHIKNRFLTKYASRLTVEGILVVTSQKHRDQITNVEECLEKLKEMLESVLNPPTPRRPTRVSKAAKIRRTEAKREVGKKKQQRRSPDADY